MNLSTHELIGRVAARRLREATEDVQDRAFFCVVGLEKPVVSAIARHVAASTMPAGQVQMFIHPRLVEGDVSPATVSDQTAPWHRNHATEGVRLTVCTVPADMVKATEPTLSHNSKIDEAWLLQDSLAWAIEGLPMASEKIREQIATALKGALGAGAAHDVVTIAEFVERVGVQIGGTQGLAPEKAVRAALPALRLPRNSGDPRLKLTDSVENAIKFFRGALDEAQPALYLKARDGDPLNRTELKRRLEQMEAENALPPEVVIKLAALLADRAVRDGGWTTTQAEVAELGWDAVEPFFTDAKRKVKPNFGVETQQFLDAQFPNALKPSEQQLLNDLVKDTAKPSDDIDSFFADHRARLATDPKLYKRWERLVFRAPVEARDLTEGLLKLAHRAVPEGDDGDQEDADRVLVVRLRGGQQMDFWQRDKNTRVLRFLRDRYRGLKEMLEPEAILDFGRCWTVDWDTVKEDNSSRSKEAVELEFEAFLVSADKLDAVLGSTSAKPQAQRAQLVWKPAPEALGLSFPQDLRRIRPQPSADATRLLTGHIQQNRSARGTIGASINLAERASINDAFNQSDGLLANDGRAEFRIDQTWPAALEEIRGNGVLTPDRADKIAQAFESFHGSYSAALEDLLRGAGVGSDELITQAQRYGDLLDAVLDNAPEEVSIRNLLAPLTSIGVISIEGERPAALLTAWHPLRLAEIGAKSRQLADAIKQVVTSSGGKRASIEDFVNDRAASLTRTYYGDVAVLQEHDDHLLSETDSLADCSLLETVTGTSHHGLTDEPADGAVAAFERVGDEYLKLRPHERANFSVVILNADSENLPLAMANGLARRIEDDPEIRCELVVTDDDTERLRQVYERQNRRISHEIDTSLASEAARNFLSRLRVGIFSPDTLTRESGLKANDIVLLQDVISRSSRVRWTRGETPDGRMTLDTYVPTSRSKRRPFKKGNTTSALYLTAPRQPAAGRAYVDALRAVATRDAVRHSEPWLPVQEVEFMSGDVAEVLAKAHALGHWVMTFDRVADRRLVSTDERRIIKYFSVPGSTHNVIVSAEISEQELGDCLSSGLDVILPDEDDATLAKLRREIFIRASRLSGGVVMRGAQWSNYASELMGLVLTQREIERMLAVGRENRTGWFFLDDYRGWLDLSGEIADIIAIDFSVGGSGPEIRIVIAEAKYVGQDALMEQRKRSAGQLESTFTAFSHRLLDTDATIDPAIWRNRLADMVLEHMDPFDQVGGITQDQWLEGLRSGDYPISVDGHSVVFSHELDAVYEHMPKLPDEDRPQADRRRLAQWVFARSTTASALRNLMEPTATPLLSVPAGWPNLSVEEPEAAEAGQQLPADDIGSAENERPAAASADDLETPAAISTVEPVRTVDDAMAPPTAAGPWSAEIHAVLAAQSQRRNEEKAEAWLAEQIAALRSALQEEGVDAPILDQRLTPNTGLIYVGGRTLTVGWLERKQTDLLTRYGLDIIRVTPMPGRIAIGLRRPTRAILHLADAWLRRVDAPGGIAQRAAPLLGEKEDDGSLCYLPLGAEYDGQERSAPHSLISGTTGSGKGILVTNVLLDLCALNAPEDLELYLIDPKRGVDYAWARRLPHLRGGIIDNQEDAKALLARLVNDMDERYEEISREGVRNIDQYNRRVRSGRRMPRIVIFFDEVANWMQDDDFKDVVDGLINKIATKSRAAGFHLFMIYQRADNQVMTMQLRTNLGNKLILRLGDEGSSKIALNEKGAERLLGKGHLIAKLDTDEKTYLQVPYIGDDEVEDLAEAVIATWSEGRQEAAE